MEGSEERIVPVAVSPFLIGRDASCQLRPASPFVSRRHAELTITGEAVTLRDLDSSNGTYVNGVAISVPAPLFHGDRVEVGPLTFTVEIDSPTTPGRVPAAAAEDVVASWLLVDDDHPPAGTVRPNAGLPEPSRAAPAGPGEVAAITLPGAINQSSMF
jgi:predicted component of type VI protein secretion system